MRQIQQYHRVRNKEMNLTGTECITVLRNRSVYALKTAKRFIKRIICTYLAYTCVNLVPIEFIPFDLIFCYQL